MGVVSVDDDVLLGRNGAGVSAVRNAKRERGTYGGIALHFGLHESQQMFLVHTTRMMNMCIDFANVIEVAIRIQV